ncbi:MAG: hypothetical protein HY836_14015 [Aquabacterium sp.]|uniref:imm11 family protein n=1 Tax=Aquabacterium sp. TaxID=1872578 RepID=UPI0025BDF099|nr:hypothetical protein [Aquabacterium sp.]MBI5926701.1 hypothetical protein [Aquabacterium sp.]
MSKYDQEYYMIVLPRQDDLNTNVFPFLTPDEATAKLPFEHSVLPVGSKPLLFRNGASDYNTKYGRTTIKHPPEVLFAGAHPVISGALREKLLHLDMPNVALQPAIYVDDWGTWNEDYWFMTFLSRLDCWDRAKSDFSQSNPPLSIGGMDFYQVYQFSLDEGVLDTTPIEERLVFQMGASLDPFVFAHRSVAGLFTRAGGAQVIAVPHFEDEY